MESNVNKLEALFLKAEADLDYASCQLEAELAAVANQETGISFNPVKMMQTIQNLKKEYEALVKEVNELREAQQKAYQLIQDEVRETCKKLQKLQVQAGAPIRSEFNSDG